MKKIIKAMDEVSITHFSKAELKLIKCMYDNAITTKIIQNGRIIRGITFPTRREVANILKIHWTSVQGTIEGLREKGVRFD